MDGLNLNNVAIAHVISVTGNVAEETKSIKTGCGIRVG